MPAKTLKPHSGAIIGKPRPGDTASMVEFIKPVIQKDTTDTNPSVTMSVIKQENTSEQRYIHVGGQTPIKVCEPIAHMSEAYAKYVNTKKFKVGDFVEICENGVVIDEGEISMVCVDMYFVETKKKAPRFWFGQCLYKTGR